MLQTYVENTFEFPLFPIFKKLELSDRHWMETFIAKHPPYSDFNFVSLWSWNIKNEAEVSVLNDNIVLKFHDYITEEPFYTILGEYKICKSINEILSHAHKTGVNTILKLVPEVVIQNLDKNHHTFTVTEDINNFDYVFSTQEHSYLTGGKYMDKRYLIKKLSENYQYSFY